MRSQGVEFDAKTFSAHINLAVEGRKGGQGGQMHVEFMALTLHIAKHAQCKYGISSLGTGAV